LSARKRDRKWKEEWTGMRTGESRPRTHGVKGRERRKGKVPTPGDGKRSKESKSMEATAEQTEENESPKVRDVTEEEGNCPDAVVGKEESTFTHEEDVHEEESAHA